MTTRASTAKKSKRAGLCRDTRGAVLAEFVVVLIPLLTIFFVFVQLSAVAAARLMVKHATIIGARAASVYSNIGDNMPDACGNADYEAIKHGVHSALGAWDKTMTTLVDVSDMSDRDENDGPFKLVTVRVTAQYKCDVPLGKVICPGGTKTLVDTKSMPHQGARYRMKADCRAGRGG